MAEETFHPVDIGKMYAADVQAYSGSWTQALEEKLVEQVRQGSPQSSEAKEQLILAHADLVIKIVTEYCPASDPVFFDLVQQGNIGLMKAANMCGQKPGVSFKHYAQWFIYQHLNEGLKKQRRLTQGLSSDQYNNSLGYFPDDEYHLPVETLVMNAELRAQVIASLKELAPRDRFILAKFYGFEDGVTYTLLQIGQMLRMAGKQDAIVTRVRKMRSLASQRLADLIRKKELQARRFDSR